MDAMLSRAVDFIAQADGLLVTAGAGMGVDSGLPDFRGTEGFWQAYPALGRAGMRFEQIAAPDNFHSRPELAWGFYGHRLALYRATVPHHGFTVLREIGDCLPLGASVFTSNVDGQFQKAGFDPLCIAECHGSIHHLQCLEACSDAIWPAEEVQPAIDADNCRMTSPLPRCPRCGSLARPNILMFGDGGWISTRTDQQEARLEAWCAEVGKRLVVIELGAGTAIPTARRYGEYHAGALIRINPREAAVRGDKAVGLSLGAIEGLARLRQGLVEAGFFTAD
jgi:NAD-dependent SIR2 family protein deacetylase